MLGIVGSRKYNDYNTIETFIATLNLTITGIVSGGATGVDSLAEQYAKKHNLPLTVFKANWSAEGKAAGPNRNTKIVNECTALVAFPDADSVGTYDTIRKAEKKGIPVFVYKV